MEFQLDFRLYDLFLLRLRHVKYWGGQRGIACARRKSVFQDPVPDQILYLVSIVVAR